MQALPGPSEQDLHVAALMAFASLGPELKKDDVTSIYAQFLQRPVEPTEINSLLEKSITHLNNALTTFRSEDFAEKSEKLLGGAKNVISFIKSSSAPKGWLPTAVSKELPFSSQKLKELPVESNLRQAAETRKQRLAFFAHERSQNVAENLVSSVDFVGRLQRAGISSPELQRDLIILCKEKPDLANVVDNFLGATIKAADTLNVDNLNKSLTALKDLEALLKPFIDEKKTDSKSELLRILATRVFTLAAGPVVELQCKFLLGPHGAPPQAALQQLRDLLGKMPITPDRTNPMMLSIKELISTLQLAQVVRDGNLNDLRANNGKVGERDDSFAEIDANLLMKMRFMAKLLIEGYTEATPAIREPESKPGPGATEQIVEQSVAEPKEAEVIELFRTIVTGSYLSNVQILTDSLLGVLPEKWRGSDFLSGRYQDLQTTIAANYARAKQELEASNAPDKAERLRDLEEKKNYTPFDLYYQQSFWTSELSEKKPGPDQLPFVKDTRVASFMSSDRQIEAHATATLDFRPLKMTTPEQSVDALQLVYKLCRIGEADSGMLKKWFDMRNKAPAPNSSEIINILPKHDQETIKSALRSFDDSQKAELLKLALNFAYQMIHDIRLARIQITL